VFAIQQVSLHKNLVTPKLIPTLLNIPSNLELTTSKQAYTGSAEFGS
jgi:hypothetical protein